MAEVFVDTSGFYASLVRKDTHHQQARAFFQRASQQQIRLLTTDHVLDETATLLKRRGFSHLLPTFFDVVLSSQACRISWTDASLFNEAVDFMLKHEDKGWSFTDCLSFVVMKEKGVSQALTSDAHFHQAGF
ncbi:MAG TPA: PIN domain-containing protein, partial [Acidobacteriota bacterium]|nr:PIN domain-containing protein [Acidobacteriota bacterium]